MKEFLNYINGLPSNYTASAFSRLRELYKSPMVLSWGNWIKCRFKQHNWVPHYVSEFNLLEICPKCKRTRHSYIKEEMTKDDISLHVIAHTNF